MNISLIGMMGSGKTTIAKLLANNLNGYECVDTDDEIVKSSGMSINEIFSWYSESYFRELETKILKKILIGNKLVVSTGGGIIKSWENISLLKKFSTVFYLKASPEVLFERIKYDDSRPLLHNSDMKQKIEELLLERETFYKQAHFTIDTNYKNPDIIVKEILRKYNG